MGPLTERHRRLARTVGRWEGTEESPDPDDGVRPRVVHDTRMVADGRIRVSDVRHEMEGRVVTAGLTVTHWDPERGACVMHWFDAAGGPPVEYVGDFDGAFLVLEGAGPAGSRIRHVTDLPAPDTMRTRSYLSLDGESWEHLTTGRHHRTPEADRPGP